MRAGCGGTPGPRAPLTPPERQRCCRPPAPPGEAWPQGPRSPGPPRVPHAHPPATPGSPRRPVRRCGAVREALAVRRLPAGKPGVRFQSAKETQWLKPRPLPRGPPSTGLEVRDPRAAPRPPERGGEQSPPERGIERAEGGNCLRQQVQKKFQESSSGAACGRGGRLRGPFLPGALVEAVGASRSPAVLAPAPRLGMSLEKAGRPGPPPAGAAV